ncbi:MAG: twin-arginine translocase subunit TatC [Thermoplasmatota archaeon]
MRLAAPALLSAALILLAAAVVAMAGVLAFRPRSRPRPMTFWGHIEELRRRLLWALLFATAGTLAALTFGVGRWNGFWVPTLDPMDNWAALLFGRAASDLLPPGVTLVAVRPMDGFAADFQVALGMGVVAALPVILWQVGAFLGPALRERERRVLAWLVAPSFLLFCVGAAFAYGVILPSAFTALYGFSTALHAQNLVTVEEFSSFVMGFLLAVGVSFQTPLVMYGLSRSGAVKAATLRGFWRHSIVGILVVAALITPDPTVVSQLLVAIPMGALFFVGLGLAEIGERQRARAL